MVTRDHPQLPRPQQIQAAISDVRIIETAPDQSKRGHGSAHTVQTGILARPLLNTRVSLAEALEQALLRIGLSRLGIDFFDTLDRDAAGKLSAFASAHAVGNHREPA